MPKKCWCGNEELKNYSEEYYKCDNCYSLVSKLDFDDSITQVKDEDSDLYGKNYWEKLMLEVTGLESINELIDMYLKERCIYWLKYLLKYTSPGANVAEIGCGLGQFPYMIKQLGYKQEAFELSKEICDYSSKELNINICNDVIQDSKTDFDAILAFDLIEHIYDPLNFTIEIFDKLKTSGILCIQTPCYDEKLTYVEMLKDKPRFSGLLEANQHIYIFSRLAIENLLKRVGFKYIQFEPAFFGDDYDMYLFASRNSISIKMDEEIEKTLNHTDNGRIYKALISLFDEKNILTQKYLNSEHDSLKRLENIEILTKQLQESEEDRYKRFENIEILTKQLEISEEDRKNRLEGIEILTKQIKICEKDRQDKIEVITNQSNLLDQMNKNLLNMKNEFEDYRRDIERVNKEKDDIVESLSKKYDDLSLAYNKLKSEYDEIMHEKNSIKLTCRNLNRLLFHKSGGK